MLDDLDTRLLAELQTDATVAQAELARRLGTSKTTVTRRIQRMVRQGVIKKELSHFALRELSAVNGIRESETLVALEVKKHPRVALM